MSRLLVHTAALLAIALMVAGCVSSPRFTMAPREGAEAVVPTPAVVGEIEEGVASYYAEEFDGRKTSNGETYDMHALTAAHRTLPFNTRVRVTSLESGKSVVVRINDRGPFKDQRIIDLSYAAAKTIEMIGTGTARVRLQVVALGDSVGNN